MGGMQIRRQTQGSDSDMTLLDGQLVDQAALFGVLMALYNMRLPLISVECLDINQEDTPSLIKIGVEQNCDFMKFTVAGDEDSLQITEPLETILNSCKLAGLTQALVDFRDLKMGNIKGQEVGYAQSVGKQYQEYLAAGGPSLRVAVVGTEEMVETWKQSEEIIQGYGMEALVTGDYEEAITWLSSKTKNS